MNRYDEIYKMDAKLFGDKPKTLLVMAMQLASLSGVALDLGAGRGNDSLYLARKGFQVTAVDSSEVGTKVLKKAVVMAKLNNVKAITADVTKFEIEENHYDLINAMNILQMLDKKSADTLLEDIKRGLKPGGLAVIATYIYKDFFKENELRQKCDDFEILFYYEGKVVDRGHPGNQVEHTHHVARIIAKKV